MWIVDEFSRKYVKINNCSGDIGASCLVKL